MITFISGPCLYAKVFESNRNLKGYEDQYVPHEGMYEIEVGVEEGGEDYRQIMGWNKRYEPKIGGKDPGHEVEKGAVEGMAYFRFKRKHKFIIQRGDKAGEIIEQWGGPPTVLNNKGEPWPKNTLIGNGSVVTVKLDVNKPENSKLTFVRLEAIRVENLVPFASSNTSAEDGSTNYPDDSIPF